eukprot:g54606.t1
MSKRQLSQAQDRKQKRARFYLVKLLPEVTKHLQASVRQPNTQIGRLEFNPRDVSQMKLVLSIPSSNIPSEILLSRREDPNKMMVF